MGTEPVRTPQGPGGVRATAQRLGRLCPREVQGFLALAAVIFIVAGQVPTFQSQQWTLWVIYGVLALSFTFVWGHCGIFSFGQAAFFGVGAYGYGVAGIDVGHVTNETVSALVIGAVAAAVVALLLGYFMFYGSIGDIYVAIVTLAVTLVLLTVMSSTAGPKYRIGEARLGGYNGVTGVLPLTVGTSGGSPVVLSTGAMFTLVLLIAAAVAMSLRYLYRRPFGRILAAVRENELRTLLLGYDVRAYKLIAFVVSAAIAGLAGALYAAWGTFVDPSVFGLQQAALVAIWVLLGGRRSLLGAFVGVLIVELISTGFGSGGGSATPLVLGVLLILVVLFLPDGVVPASVDFGKRGLRLIGRGQQIPVPGSGLVSVRASAGEAVMANQAGRATLEAIAIGKQFGGLVALSGASMEFPPGSVTCLIGPNGAGKSTFFNLLIGRYKPTHGAIKLDGRDITRTRPDERARRGLGIKLQVPSIYSELAVFENVWLAAFGRVRSSRKADEKTLAVLEWLDMSGRSADEAGNLSHGEHQWLEIGMVVAANPQVVLLDEPTGGMTRSETSRTVDLIRQLAQFAAVVVVEHDMEFVRELNAPVTMFHEGQIFASGSIDELRQDERVLDIYLGRPRLDVQN